MRTPPPKGPFCQSCAMPMNFMPEADARKLAETVLPKLKQWRGK